MNKETLITEYLITHKDGLLEKIAQLNRPGYEYFPDSLYEIYLEQYEKKALQIIKEEIQYELQLTPEELLNISKETVILVLGKEILCPS